MRKLVLLAATLAIVLLVVAPALSQTDDGSNTDEGGIVDNIRDLLGSVVSDDEGDDAVVTDDGVEGEEGNEADDGDEVDEGDDAVVTDDGDEEEEGNNDDEGSEGDDTVVTDDGEDANTDTDAGKVDEGDDAVVTDDGDEEEEGNNDDEGDESDDTVVTDEGDEGEDRDDGQNRADEDNRVNADAVGDDRNRDGGHNRNDGGSGDDTEFTWSFEQDADSGDINQTFSITGPGDNASQCLGISPVTNTGNAQNHISVQPGGGDVDGGRGDRDKGRDRNGGGDFVFDDVNATLDVSGGSTVTCDQQVNQAATASGS